MYDAFEAAQQIQANTVGLDVKKYHFPNTKWIVEREIEIISEALKRASAIQNNLLVTDMNKIFATRNKIVQEYDIVDPFMLYNIVQKNIPVLITELQAFIKTLETT